MTALSCSAEDLSCDCSKKFKDGGIRTSIPSLPTMQGVDSATSVIPYSPCMMLETDKTDFSSRAMVSHILVTAMAIP